MDNKYGALGALGGVGAGAFPVGLGGAGAIPKASPPPSLVQRLDFLQRLTSKLAETRNTFDSIANRLTYFTPSPKASGAGPEPVMPDDLSGQYGGALAQLSVTVDDLAAIANRIEVALYGDQPNQAQVQRGL